MYKVGLSTCSKTINEELFKNYQKSGISAMEIALASKDYADIDYKNLKKMAENFNIDLWSFHLPFSPSVEYDISNGNISEATMRCYEDLIKKASEIGIKRYIIHSGGEPIEDKDRPERMKRAKENLAVLAEFAQKNDAFIAVEDLPRTCLGRDSDEVAELISLHDRLMVCFDTNHLLTENPVDFIHKIGNRIITTHISDYDFANERHWLPGEGKLDWQAILQALKDVEYQGVWLYEIAFSCPKTIIRNRDLTCEDFARNAGELFENKDITIFSTHKEKLGMWE